MQGVVPDAVFFSLRFFPTMTHVFFPFLNFVYGIENFPELKTLVSILTRSKLTAPKHKHTTKRRLWRQFYSPSGYNGFFCGNFVSRLHSDPSKIFIYVPPKITLSDTLVFASSKFFANSSECPDVPDLKDYFLSYVQNKLRGYWDYLIWRFQIQICLYPGR